MSAAPVKAAFLGTPAIAVPALDALAADDAVDLAVVVTNPDRPRGRKRAPVPPPVKEAATAHGIPVLQPERPADVLDELRALDLDIAAVVAYGALLPRAVLDVTEHGFVNLHFSLLPRWRGAAPVQRSLMAGDTMTGVTTFVLDEGMDTGPILIRREVEIGSDETAGDLLERLAVLGAPILVQSVTGYARGEIEPTPQDDDGATLAPKIGPDDARIDWTWPAARIVNLVRGVSPRPGAHTTFRGDRLKIYRARTATREGAGKAGQVVGATSDGPVVAAGTGAVELLEVQPSGKARMAGTDFANGYQPDGEVLGHDDR